MTFDELCFLVLFDDPGAVIFWPFVTVGIILYITVRIAHEDPHHLPPHRFKCRRVYEDEDPNGYDMVGDRIYFCCPGAWTQKQRTKRLAKRSKRRAKRFPGAIVYRGHR